MSCKNRASKLEDAIWASFCLKSQDDDNKQPIVQKRFQNHPKQLDSDNSTSSTTTGSLEQLHWNTNFDRADSQEEFANVGIIELNNNELLNDLNVIKSNVRVAKKQSDDKFEVKSVIRVARLLSSKTKREIGKGSKEKMLMDKEKIDEKNVKVPPTKPQRVECKTAIDNKLKSVVEKILCSIDEIKTTMDGEEILPDGAEDLARRKKRANEFAGRFSRMYLYQLGRQLADLQRLSKLSSGYGAYSFDCQQKLFMAHQLSMQGFQAYHNHLPTSVPQGIPDKLRELINDTMSLCDVHRNLINCDISLVAKRSQMIDELENHCKSLGDRIQEKLHSVVSLMSLNSKPSVTATNVKNGQSVGRNKRKLQTRLSMYNSQMGSQSTERFWKKTVSNVSKKKYNVQSRYKTATLKHRPPPIKEVPDHGDTSKPIKLDGQRSVDSVTKNSKTKCSYGDDVETMVQLDNDVTKDSDEDDDRAVQTEEVVDIKNDILRPLTRSIFEQFCEENKEMSQNEFEMLLRKLLILARNNDNRYPKAEQGGGGADRGQLIVQSLQQRDKGNNDPIDGNQMRKTKSENGVNNVKDAKKQTITVTGAKNAQLICIRDDRSIVDDPYANCIEESVQNRQEMKIGETQTDDVSPIKLNEDRLTSKNSVIKISRLPKKSFKILDVLPKETALNVIEYKLDFSKTNKKNHMYTKTDRIQPWVVTGKIADNILQDVLLAVVREIEINEILENLYRSEFM